MIKIILGRKVKLLDFDIFTHLYILIFKNIEIVNINKIYKILIWIKSK